MNVLPASTALENVGVVMGGGSVRKPSTASVSFCVRPHDAEKGRLQMPHNGALALCSELANAVTGLLGKCEALLATKLATTLEWPNEDDHDVFLEVHANVQQCACHIEELIPLLSSGADPVAPCDDDAMTVVQPQQQPQTMTVSSSTIDFGLLNDSLQYSIRRPALLSDIVSGSQDCGELDPWHCVNLIHKSTRTYLRSLNTLLTEFMQPKYPIPPPSRENASLETISTVVSVTGDYDDEDFCHEPEDPSQLLDPITSFECMDSREAIKEVVRRWIRWTADSPHLTATAHGVQMTTPSQELVRQMAFAMENEEEQDDLDGSQNLSRMVKSLVGHLSTHLHTVRQILLTPFPSHPTATNPARNSAKPAISKDRSLPMKARVWTRSQSMSVSPHPFSSPRKRSNPPDLQKFLPKPPPSEPSATSEDPVALRRRSHPRKDSSTAPSLRLDSSVNFSSPELTPHPQSILPLPMPPSPPSPTDYLAPLRLPSLSLPAGASTSATPPSGSPLAPPSTHHHPRRPSFNTNAQSPSPQRRTSRVTAAAGGSLNSSQLLEINALRVITF